MSSDVAVRDVRKSQGLEVEGNVIKYFIHNEQLFLNLDTGYEIRIDIQAIRDAISEIVSKEVLERLKE